MRCNVQYIVYASILYQHVQNTKHASPWTVIQHGERRTRAAAESCKSGKVTCLQIIDIKSH